ncbi:MAG: mechanosensitive ion channel family protein [Nanoarchaeota archaeon]|nr:mechanosensitive ion channel family protein [Nanoarchaeota archaeon]
MAGMVDYFTGLYASLQERFSGFFSKFLVAVIILLVGFIIGKILGRLMYKFLHGLEVNENLKKMAGVKVGFEEIIEAFTTYFIYFITIVTVLQQLGLATTVLNMIAGGVIVIIILSTLLGVKDFIPNAVAGFVLQRKDFLKVGEVIKVKGMQGKIIHISLVETKIETKDKDIIFIPNSVLTKTEVIKVRPKKEGKGKKQGSKPKKSLSGSVEKILEETKTE